MSLETIRKVCLEGPGHYLGSDQTLRLMQRDYVYPIVGDRTSPKEWVERDSTNIVQKAMKQVKLILDRNFRATCRMQWTMRSAPITRCACRATSAAEGLRRAPPQDRVIVRPSSSWAASAGGVGKPVA